MLSTELREKVRRLESLRRQADFAARQSGSLSDYIDLGRPNDEQRARAYADMALADERFKQLSARLTERIAALRRSDPPVLEAWIALHRQACGDILAESSPDERFAEVRAFVAGETLAAWERLARGDTAFVHINWYFLRGYEELWDRLLEEPKGLRDP